MTLGGRDMRNAEEKHAMIHMARQEAADARDAFWARREAAAAAAGVERGESGSEGGGGHGRGEWGGVDYGSDAEGHAPNVIADSFIRTLAPIQP